MRSIAGGEDLTDNLENISKLLLCLHQFRSTALVQVMSLVYLTFAAGLTEHHLLLTKLLVGKVQKMLAVTVTRSRS